MAGQHRTKPDQMSNQSSRLFQLRFDLPRLPAVLQPYRQGSIKASVLNSQHIIIKSLRKSTVTMKKIILNILASNCAQNNNVKNALIYGKKCADC